MKVFEPSSFMFVLLQSGNTIGKNFHFCCKTCFVFYQQYHKLMYFQFLVYFVKSCSRGNPALQALLNWGVMVGNIGVIYLENWSPAGNVSPANYRKNPFNQWWWSGKRQTKNVAGKFTFYQLQEEMHKHQINIERTFSQSPHAF